MPKRDWFGNAALAVAGLAVLVLMVACAAGIIISEYAKVHEVNAAYQRNAEEDRRKAGDKIAQACQNRDGSAFRLCISDHLESYYRDQATNHDLQAQQDMALWAKWAVAASFATIVVTAIGVWLVWQTLDETATATKVLTDEFVAAHPPHFRIHQIKLNLAKWIDPPSRHGEVFVFNAGSTKAIIVGSTIVFHAGEHPPASRPFDHARSANPLKSQGSIFEKGEGHWWKFKGDGCAASAEQIAHALDAENSTKFFIIGRLHYSDLQGVGRHVVFCRVYDPKSGRFIPTNDPDYEYQT